MPTYFRGIPDFKYISRDPKYGTSLDDYVIVKNLFKRGKLRSDIFENLAFFEKYTIEGDDRPDNVAEKLYGDPTLDWVVLQANNILNVYEEWPKTQIAFDKYCIEKYQTYDNLYGGIHHYETLEHTDTEGIVILPAGKIVTKSFYDAPEYAVETDKDINLPALIPGIFAEGTATVGGSNGEVTGLFITGPGAGYTDIGSVTISAPGAATTATARCTLNAPPDDMEVGQVTIIDSGQAYTYQPGVTFSDPKETVAGILTATVGVGTTNSGQLAMVSIANSGDGYNFTPIVTIAPPPDPIGNAIYVGISTYQLPAGFEGMHISPAGDRAYMAFGSLGYTVGEIHEWVLSTPWDLSTAVLDNIKILNFTLTFTYATGIDFKPDGKTMYVSGQTSSGFKVAQYSLSTAWDLGSTVTYVTSISTVSPSGVRFQDNGSHMFLMDTDNPDTIRKYELITPWLISSAISTPVQTLNIGNLCNSESTSNAFNFKDDGSELYISGLDNASVYILTCGTNWDLTSLTLKGTLNVSSKDSNPLDAFTNPTSTRFIVAGGTGRYVHTYNIDLTATATVSLVGENLAVTAISNPGGTYDATNPPLITVQPPTPHRRATGYTLVNDGKVTDIIMQDRGYNYRSAPTIAIDPPTQPITATATVKTENGKVVDIFLGNAGSGYYDAPTLRFSEPGPLYVPQSGEVFERDGQEWRYDGYNWRKRLSYGVIYNDPNIDSLVEKGGKDISKSITNIEYEQQIEDKKREIYVLKGQFLGIILDDQESESEYKKGSEQYLSRTLKKGDNPRLYE